MKKKIIAGDLYFGSNVKGNSLINTWSEFYFILAIAKSLGEMGYSFDISKCKYGNRAKDWMVGSIVGYRNSLIQRGFLIVGKKMEEKVLGKEEDYPISELEMDVSYYDATKNLYNRSKKGVAKWSPDWVRENYKENLYPISSPNYGNILLHMVSGFIARRLIGVEKDTLELYFNSQDGQTYYRYLDVYSAINTNEFLAGVISIEVQEVKNSGIDIEYELFCHNSVKEYRYNHTGWTIKDKLRAIEKVDIREGMICNLWRRGRFSGLTRHGQIMEVHVVRIDEITEEYIKYQVFNVMKTKEESLMDYYSIAEDKRSLYADMLNPEMYTYSDSLFLLDVGIDGYMSDEDYVLTKIDTRKNLVKTPFLVTIDGDQKKIEMEDYQAIYWILKQYGVEFDEDLYASMYNNGEDMLYDLKNR